MPSAVPADAAARLPKARMIDPRGHRFGAGVSAVLLIVAFVLERPMAGGAWSSCRSGRARRSACATPSMARSGAGSSKVAQPRPHRARTRVPAAVRAGPRLGRADAVARLVHPRRDRRSAGSSRSRSPACSRSSALTGYCLGCRLYFLRGGCRTSSRGIWTRGATPGEDASSWSRSPTSRACATQVNGREPPGLRARLHDYARSDV